MISLTIVYNHCRFLLIKISMFLKNIYIEHIPCSEQVKKTHVALEELWILKQDPNQSQEVVLQYKQRIDNLLESSNWTTMTALEDYFDIITKQKIPFVMLNIKFPLSASSIWSFSFAYQYINENSYWITYNWIKENFSNFNDLFAKLIILLQQCWFTEGLKSKKRSRYKEDRYLFTKTIEQCCSIQNVLPIKEEDLQLLIWNNWNSVSISSRAKQFEITLIKKNSSSIENTNYESSLLTNVDSLTRNQLISEPYFKIYEQQLWSVLRWTCFPMRSVDEYVLMHCIWMIEIANQLEQTILSRYINFSELYKMIIFHDAWEIITGDIPLSCWIKDNKLTDKERKEAINNIFNQIQNKNLRKQIIELYNRAETYKKPTLISEKERNYIEYIIPTYKINSIDKEALLLKLIDKLQGLQWWLNNLFSIDNLNPQDFEKWIEPLPPQQIEMFYSWFYNLLQDEFPEWIIVIESIIFPWMKKLYDFRLKFENKKERK